MPTEDPKTKAQSVIDSLPGNSLISKTAILSSAAGLSIYALSNEYYVVNEETIVAFSLLSVWAGLIKYGGPMYKQWAETQNNRIKGILNAARADHTQAVQNRISSVQQMSGVTEVTKSLFEVSKVRETVGGGGNPRFNGFISTHPRLHHLSSRSIGICRKAHMLPFVGNRPARGSGLRARAKDCHRRRSQGGSRLVGPI